MVILPADKGRVTVLMDKTNYHDKMDELVNDKQTYATPALHLTLKMTSAQVVETSVNVISNSPSHTHSDDSTSLWQVV